MYRELRASDVKTRKHHVCEWCDERIDAGATAFSRTYHWESRIHTGHMHLECRDAYDEADTRDLEEGWMPGDYARGSTEPK